MEIDRQRRDDADLSDQLAQLGVNQAGWSCLQDRRPALATLVEGTCAGGPQVPQWPGPGP